MTEIEQRTELPDRPDIDYGAERITEAEAAGLRHRRYVGGMWEEGGRIQHDFLVAQGLEPSHRFLDVGCGSFRAGVHLIDHLEPGHYFGIDINPDVIRSGYDHELTEDQQQRLPRSNLRATDRFDADFGVAFDMAIAQSVFTHIPLNNIRLCLYRVAKVMKPGGRFFASFTERPAGFPIDGTRGKRFTERNGFWYYRDDLRWASSCAPWEFRYIGDWDHPRGLKMVEFTRLKVRPSIWRTTRP